MEHRYTTAERMKQLKTLIAALDDLIPLVIARPEYSARAAEYRVARDRAEDLARVGFEQADLSELSRFVPDLSYRDWEPLEQVGDGMWREPAWFVEFKSKHDSVVDAAMSLRMVGHYMP